MKLAILPERVHKKPFRNQHFYALMYYALFNILDFNFVQQYTFISYCLFICRA
jgi:hypothetical protein